MRRWSFVILAMILMYPLGAQSIFNLIETQKGKVIIMPRPAEVNFEFSIPPTTYHSYTPASTYNIDLVLQEFQPDLQPTSIDQRPMDMQILSKAYFPFFNEYTPMLRKVSPMAFDFRETSVVPLSDQFTFLVTGEQHTWPGLGGLTTISPAVAWHLDGLTVTGNTFGGRYYTPFNQSPEFVLGAGLHARYDINERFAVMGWGQYAHYFEDEKQNPHMLLNPFFYHTSVGGAFEVKISDQVGVGFGVNYEYNPRYRRMEPQYLMYPVFKNNNIQIRWR